MEFAELRGLRSLLRGLKEQRGADVVFVDGWKNKTAWAGLYAAARFHLPVVIRTDSTAFYRSTRSFTWFVRKLVLRGLLSPASGAAYVSEGARAHLRLLGFSEEMCLRVPYTTDVSRISADAATAGRGRSDRRLSFGFAPTDLVAIAVTKLNQREGVLTLLDAIAKVVKVEPRLRLLLVGAGPLDAEVRAHPAAEAVTAVGYKPYNELPAWYSLADCFIHAAPREPWGVSVVEALACGLPQILSDGVGAARELVRQGQNGFVVPANDSDALAKAVLTWAGLSENEKARMREAASSSTRTFEYEYVAAALLDWVHRQRSRSQ
ncbi:MAG TPA: glycosyltransferase family 4 protein [Acidimicrobiales bacterium]|nr:glycosyltransferase family 4 protein [Acidimicrobiales bacterium]